MASTLIFIPHSKHIPGRWRVADLGDVARSDAPKGTLRQGEYRAGMIDNYRIGWWTVTNLVPSGNVPST